MITLLRLRYLVFLITLTLSTAGVAADSKWIWSDEGGAPPGTDPRFFRSTVELPAEPAKATLAITCDNGYTLHINGKLIGSGSEWQTPGSYDVTKALIQGKNAIAVRAVNSDGPAGLLVHLKVALKSGANVELASDKSWLASSKEEKDWQSPAFPAAGWKACVEVGPAGGPPWNLAGWPNVGPAAAEVAAPEGMVNSNGFLVPEGFVVETYASHEFTNSVLALAFNAKGQLFTGTASAGPAEVRLLEDKDGDGVVDGFKVYEEKIHCQGLCVVGTDLYAVGNNKLYLLPDKNGDGVSDGRVALSEKDLGGMGEHGPHGIVHAADGHLYIIMGNSSNWSMDNVTEKSSPIQKDYLYWGNLLPRQSSNFMDNAGPPAGRILRVDVSAKKWEVVACGFRNAYDLAFNSWGEIFSFDSDMEWDIGLPWYRPVRICHVPSGAEFGWRTGSGKWKSYYADNVPGMIEAGRGSPTGVENYDHTAFPADYRDAQFHCDWALGKVYVVKSKRAGATYTGTAEIFLAATGAGASTTGGGGSQRLPVTDCIVGPDGSLYVSYGGRGSSGGVLRVRYTGDAAMKTRFRGSEVKGIPAPVAGALSQPQRLTAWARAAVAAFKQQAGGEWTAQLAKAARNIELSTAVRVAALNLLGADADPIDPALLNDLAKDVDAVVRAHAAWRIGLSGDANALPALRELLKDSDAWTLRRACEALQRHPDDKTIDALVALLGHEDRFVRFAAQSALLRHPSSAWSEKAAAAATPLARAAGLLIWAQSFQRLQDQGDGPTPIAPQFEKMITLASQLLDVNMPPEHMLIAQRAVALTLIARKDRRAIPPAIAKRLVDHSLALLDGDKRVAAEAAELLGFLGDARGVEPLVNKVKDAALDRTERIQYATAAVNIPGGWKPESVAVLAQFFANPGAGSNGAQFTYNMRQAYGRLGKNVPSDVKWAALDTLSDDVLAFTLSSESSVSPDDEVRLRKRILQTKNRALQEEIINKIAGGNTNSSFKFLESIYDEASPLHDVVLIHLMRAKTKDARPYIIKGLSSLNPQVAGQALRSVIDEVKINPKNPDMYFGLIACASRAVPQTRAQALAQLDKWSFLAENPKDFPAQPVAQVDFWQKAFKKSFPDYKKPFPQLSGEGYQDDANYAKLVEFLKQNPPRKTGDAAAGRKLYTDARCVTCHAFRGEGQMVGPELSEVAKRFDSLKILEEIVHPSRAVDGRFRQVTFTTADGQRVTGFVSSETDETKSVTDVNNVTTILKKKDITKTQVMDLSIMPQGLIDNLKPEQIRDLISFLESDKK